MLRQDAVVPYSCRNGVCLTCMMRSRAGAVPACAQNGLKDTLRVEGHFFACLCTPQGDLDIELPNDAEVFGRATVRAVEQIAPTIRRVVLEPATPLYYHAGQFVNLRRGGGLARSYSLAGVPRLDDGLELHVKRLPRGRMSTWFHEAAAPGDGLDIQGPNGDCFYLPGRPDTSLLLVGNGSGLAPLIGIARDALASGHRGSIHLYHGSRHREGLYRDARLRAMAERHANFTYRGCVSGDDGPAGRADNAAFADHPDLAGWRVYLCGYPPMVKTARKRAYLMGAALADIHANPFDLRNLRVRPRD